MNEQNNILFTSLGGVDKVGMNCYLYGFKNKNGDTKWIMIDCGIAFSDFRYNFIPSYLPNLDFVKKIKKDVLGIFVTHGHEDHIGAFPYLWKEYLKDIPIYATPFVTDMVKEKLRVYKKQIDFKEVETNTDFYIDELKLRFITNNHSISESSFLHIVHNDNSVLHTGDWKILTDDILENLKPLVSKVDFLTCDSTNILNKSKGKNIPEGELVQGFDNLFTNSKQAIWITLFASNVERISNIIELAEKHGKKVIFLLNTFKKYIKYGIKHGYIKESKAVISLDELKDYDRKDVVYVLSGSQAPQRSILWSIIMQESYRVKLEAGDDFVFSSRVIPGNNLRVQAVVNKLYKMKVNVHTSDDLHTTGHACYEDIKQLYTYLKPATVIPMHGDTQFIYENAKLARSLGCKAIEPHVGELLSINKDGSHSVQKHIECEKLVGESNRLFKVSDDVVKKRDKVSFEGYVSLTMAINSKDELKLFNLDTIGLLTSKEQSEKHIEEFLKAEIMHNLNNTDDKRENVRLVVRRFFRYRYFKRPIINLVLLKTQDVNLVENKS